MYNTAARRTCNIARTFYNFIAPLFLFIFLDRQLKKPADKFSNWVYFVALSLSPLLLKNGHEEEEDKFDIIKTTEWKLWAEYLVKPSSS